MEAAQRLLARGQSVTEVCFDVGFSSVGSFSTLFARHTGMTPSSVRRTAVQVPLARHASYSGVLCVALLRRPDSGFSLAEPAPAGFRFSNIEKAPDIALHLGSVAGEPDFRWLTIGPKGQPDIEIVLMPIGPGPMSDEATAAQVRALVKKGAFGAGVFETPDVHATYEALKAKGVEFLSPPTERPYGIEAVVRDNSGNWFSLTQRK